MSHSYQDVIDALAKKELTAEERDLAVSQAEEVFGRRSAETTSDIIGELQSKPEPKKASKSDASKKGAK